MTTRIMPEKEGTQLFPTNVDHGTHGVGWGAAPPSAFVAGPAWPRKRGPWHPAPKKSCVSFLVVFLAVLLVLASTAARGAGGRSVEVVAKGTAWATPCYIQDSGSPGPTVMITAGLHGNEPAGAYAADQIRHWPIKRGRIIVLPRANIPALKANKRNTPDADKDQADLNRNFPRAGKGEQPRGTPAKQIWQLLTREKPTWLVDLHEGYDFRQINPKSTGSSIIVQPSPGADEACRLMLAAVNTTVTEEKKKFVRLRPPAGGSLARAAAEHLGASAMILETTRKDQRLTRRTRQHRIMAHRLLGHLKMIDPSVQVDLVTDRRRPRGWMKVALFDDSGTGGKGPGRLRKLFGAVENTTIVRIGRDEVRSGALAQFDLVIFPGGSGSAQARTLDEPGREKVRRFVKGGGGYIGICGGAFLAADGFTWGLKILDAKTVSRKWRRGKGNVKIELTDQGRAILGHAEGRLDVLYANGPIIKPAGSKLLDDYVTLAHFRTELAENDSPKGVMVNSPAIVAGRFGKGRVICFSPHPEQSDKLAGFVLRAAAWVRKTSP